MKKFLAGIWPFLLLQSANIGSWIETHIEKAVQLVNQIRAFVDNPALDVLTQFIPGDVDNEVLAWLRQVLGPAINTMAITAGITSEPDFLKKLKMTVLYVRKNLSPIRQRGFYIALTSAIAQASAKAAKDDKIDSHVVDMLASTRMALQASKVDVETLQGGSADEAKQIYYDPATLSYK